MAIRARQSFIIAQAVAHDLAALAAHRLVGLRQENVSTALIERLDKPLPVEEIDRRAFRVIFRFRREFACSDKESALGVGGDN